MRVGKNTGYAIWMHRRRFPDCAGIKRNPYDTAPNKLLGHLTEKAERFCPTCKSVKQTGTAPQERMKQVAVLSGRMRNSENCSTAFDKKSWSGRPPPVASQRPPPQGERVKRGKHSFVKCSRAKGKRRPARLLRATQRATIQRFFRKQPLSTPGAGSEPHSATVQLKVASVLRPKT